MFPCLLAASSLGSTSVVRHHGGHGVARLRPRVVIVVVGRGVSSSLPPKPAEFEDPIDIGLGERFGHERVIILHGVCGTDAVAINGGANHEGLSPPAALLALQLVHKTPYPRRPSDCAEQHHEGPGWVAVLGCHQRIHQLILIICLCHGGRADARPCKGRHGREAADGLTVCGDDVEQRGVEGLPGRELAAVAKRPPPPEQVQDLVQEMFVDRLWQHDLEVALAFIDRDLPVDGRDAHREWLSSQGTLLHQLLYLQRALAPIHARHAYVKEHEQGHRHVTLHLQAR
mmetsp:Transcript_41749/g.135013  ORF Transcript_41749/g.135013 Transcript_41749/m.135013 type:complete len:286 (+) Transcript_41749:352-1209(+)